MADSPGVVALAKQIQALSIPDKLRLAADLIERQRPETAVGVVDCARTELLALTLPERFRRLDERMAKP